MENILQACRTYSRLANIFKMLPEFVAQLPEFSLAGVFETELEGHARDVVIQRFHVRVRTQQLQTLAVGFPQEFHLMKNYGLVKLSIK